MFGPVSERIGEPKTWPKDPDAILALLDQLFQKNLMEDDPAKRMQHRRDLRPRPVPHAHHATSSQMAGPQGSRLVRLLSSAQNPYIKRSNIAICLLCDQLSELNERLVGSPHVATLEVPMPDAAARQAFATWFDGQDGQPRQPDRLHPDPARRPDQRPEPGEPGTPAGPGREIGQSSSTRTASRSLKKGLIERQARGLVEFVEPPHTLDDFVGNDGVKQRLVDDAALLAKGRLDAAPMGYLICGPVGTGKTYLAECFAGSVGVPCVKLRNFRSKYVGETEGNLEQLLDRAPRDGAGGRGHRRGRRGAGQPRVERRLGHVGPGLLDDRQPDGRHPLPRQADLDAPDQPARPAADRPQAAGPGRGAPAAVQPARRGRSAVHVQGHGQEEQGRPQPRPAARRPGRQRT